MFTVNHFDIQCWCNVYRYSQCKSYMILLYRISKLIKLIAIKFMVNDQSPVLVALGLFGKGVKR